MRAVGAFEEYSKRDGLYAALADMFWAVLSLRDRGCGVEKG